MQTISSALSTALAAYDVKPTTKVLMHLSNNAVYNASLDAEPKSNADTVIDGIYEPSMRFAFADTDTILDSNYRVFPIEEVGPQIPWVSDGVCNEIGVFAGPVRLKVNYPTSVTTNKIVVTSDPFGRTFDSDSDLSPGVISSLDVKVKKSGTWYTVVSDWKPGSYKAELYLKNTSITPGIWTTGVPSNLGSVSIAIDAIEIIVHKIVVDRTLPPRFSYKKKRHLLIYEVDAAYVANISTDVISWSIAKTRDLTGQPGNLSPIGVSAANTFNLVLSNHSDKYNNLLSTSIYNGLLVPNVKFEVWLGFTLADSTIEYVQQGVFFADTWNVSDDTAQATVDCRDGSKYLQEKPFDSVVYIGEALHEIVKDVVERSGIKDHSIDTSALSTVDLGTGANVQLLGIDEISTKARHNIVWTEQGDTAWTFLNKVAASDLGVFYFDETGKFHYVAKESLSDPSQMNSILTISDSDYIKTASYTQELTKNSISLDYIVPEISKFGSPLWEADDPTILSSTALANGVDAFATIWEVGDISDWPEQGYFYVNNRNGGHEIVKYNDRTDTVFLECERGQLGTKPAPHYPDVDSVDNWTINKHDWEITGGYMKVTGSAQDWGYAITNRTFGNNITVDGKFKTTAGPWKAGFIFRAQDSNNLYRFVAKTVGEIGDTNHGTTGPGLNSLYSLVRRKAGAETIIAVSDKNDYKILTDNWTAYRFTVDEQNFNFYLNDHLILHYSDTSANAFTSGGGVGLAAIGRGPTYFDDFTVSANSDAGSGEVRLFHDHFGKPIYELRRFDAEYNLFPARGIQYGLTNPDAEVIRFDPGPLGATAYVRNLVDDLTMIEGTRTDVDGFPELFYMYGNAVEQATSQNMTKDDKDSIKQNGKQELSIQLPWVQSRKHAQALLNYLVSTYKHPVIFSTVGTMALPHLQLGDLVTVDYDRLWATPRDCHITGINISYSGGIDQTLTLRSRAESTLSGYTDGVACASEVPPDGFYIGDGKTSFAQKLVYKGYNKRASYRLSDSPATNGSYKIPFTVYSPSSVAGRIQNGVLQPSSSATNGSFPTIIWAHGSFARTYTERSNYDHVRWLQKIVRAGFNVVFVDYRGSGGYGPNYFEDYSILHEDLNDIKVVGNWVASQTWHKTGRMAFMGFGYGGTMALYGSVKASMPFSAYVSLSGTPDIGCTIQQWPNNADMNAVKSRIYSSFGGRPGIASSTYNTIRPKTNVASVTKPILMVNGGLDSLSYIKDVYAFKKSLATNNKTYSALAWQDLGQGFMFSVDGSNPNTAFQSDYWNRIMSWLHSWRTYSL